jgi:hypothetical protein
LAYSRSRLDFGQGFYTTTVRQQAEAFAHQKASIEVKRNPTARPGVVAFIITLDGLAKLDCLCFVRGHPDADDFWSLVFYCRSGQSEHGRVINGGWYDVVIGPVVAGSWRQRGVYLDRDQVSFHTEEAVKLLNSVSVQRRQVI